MSGVGAIRGLYYRLARWYRLNHGLGRAMREAGARVLACPHCGRDTPVYRSAYGRDGRPVSFSVCLWCAGLIEYGLASRDPHEPYARATDARSRESGR